MSWRLETLFGVFVHSKAFGYHDRSRSADFLKSSRASEPGGWAWQFPWGPRLPTFR
jgi:hypothetical protein